MEIQLQELIEQIKKDGVEVAENEAKSIVDYAKEEEMLCEGIAFRNLKTFDEIVYVAEGSN